MAGPTFFSEVLSNWLDLSKKAHELNGVEDLKTYCVLLIITDGTIYDERESVRLMVEASNYPCSVIIVGVGDGDFSQMQALDSDEKLLKDDKRRKCKRDIVQFVPLNRARAQGNLREAVLREIPDQVCGYMEAHNFQIDPTKLDEKKQLA